jgi:DNA-binding transcriptional MerR regulator
MKRGGGRRYYRPEDLELLKGIRHLLHAQAYTIKGVQKILREQGVEFVKRVWQESGAEAPAAAAPAGPTPRRRVGTAVRSPATKGAARLSSAHRKLVERAIRELEACRALLEASPEEPRAAPRAARRA